MLIKEKVSQNTLNDWPCIPLLSSVFFPLLFPSFSCNLSFSYLSLVLPSWGTFTLLSPPLLGCEQVSLSASAQLCSSPWQTCYWLDISNVSQCEISRIDHVTQGNCCGLPRSAPRGMLACTWSPRLEALDPWPHGPDTSASWAWKRMGGRWDLTHGVKSWHFLTPGWGIWDLQKYLLRSPPVKWGC